MRRRRWMSGSACAAAAAAPRRGPAPDSRAGSPTQALAPGDRCKHVCFPYRMEGEADMFSCRGRGSTAVRASPDVKLGLLGVVTALMATLARHVVAKGWGTWETVTQLVGGVFIHFIALVFLVAVSGAAIIKFHKYFL
jgi:hypothetical protein